MTTQTYQQASQRFLAQAKQELAAGDLQQASEKGWGATAQILKAVAEQRGWEHSRHRHHLVTVSRLRAETGDGDIRRLFNTASALHENFYENTMSAEDIAESLDDVQALLDRLERVDIHHEPVVVSDKAEHNPLFRHEKLLDPAPSGIEPFN